MSPCGLGGAERAHEHDSSDSEVELRFISLKADLDGENHSVLSPSSNTYTAYTLKLIFN